MIEKILKEISRLKKELDGYSAFEALDYIESYINATSRESASEDLEEACDNYYDETWDEHGGIATVVNNCHDIWFPSQATRDFFKAGAEWQKQHMMKDAVDATVYEGLFHKYIKEQDKNALLKALANFENGDRVKFIIVKED